jgi:hypothetical protein
MQVAAQDPSTQAIPGEQALSQAPQWAGSVRESTQALPPQSVVPAGQKQVPSAQDAPAGQG